MAYESFDVKGFKTMGVFGVLFGFLFFILETEVKSVYEVKYITRTTGGSQPILSFLCLNEVLLLDSGVFCSGAQPVLGSAHCVRKHETIDLGGLGSPAAHYNCIYSSELNSSRNFSWALKLDCPPNSRKILGTFLPETAAIFPNNSSAWSGN